MTVNPIGISNPNQPYDPTSMQTRMQQALTPVAQLFGESSDQLMSELQSGHTSLSALAASKGISQTDLVNAIKSGLQQSAPNGTTLSDTQLTNIANRIANHKHGGHHHHGGGGGGVSATSSSTDPTATTSTTSTSSSDPTLDALQQLLNADAPASIDQSF